MKAKAAAKAPEKINPLTEYLVNESTREGAGPDAATDAQIDLLMSEDESQEEAADQEPPKASPPAKRRKPTPKAQSRRKKRR